MKKRFERLVVITLALSMVFTQPLALMAAESDYLGGNTSVEMGIETDELSLSENSEQVAEEDKHQMEVSQDDLTGNTISENTLSDEMISVSGELVNKEVSEEPAGEGNGNVAAICMRDRRSMAIDTYGNLWEWGGDNEYVDDPEYLQPRKYKDAKNVVDVSIGSYHSHDSSTFESWAYVDSAGNLKGDAIYNEFSKDNIDKLSLAQDGFSYYFAGAIDKSGKLWVWPYTDGGQSGVGKAPDFDNPVIFMSDIRFKELSFGKDHYAAIDTEGNLWIWGTNYHGQLGNGSSSGYSTYIEPSKVKSGTKFKKVSLGADQSAAIDTEGNLWTWGNNRDGALGDGTRQDRYTPAKVMEGTLFKEVSLGNSHGVAVDVNGNLWTWGTNRYGELGNGSVDSSYTIHTPEKIMQDTYFTEVSLGDNHSAAIDTNGDLWVWGLNYMGQIGDGTKTDCSTPKLITIPDASPTPKCTVSFNSMGGSEVPSQKLASGSYVTKPADPTRKGYQFGGWYKDSKCTQAWDFNSDKVTENPTILYAKWIEIRQMSNPRKGENATTWDCIWFGHYFQEPQYIDNRKNLHMDKDSIKWRILDIDENGEALLLSDKNLDIRMRKGKDWKVEEWLNKDNYSNSFKRDAFTFLEQKALIGSNGNKVFLLSSEDVNKTQYGFSGTGDDADGRRVAENTAFCDNGDSECKYNMWFIEGTKIVGEGGNIFENTELTDMYKIRPAIRLNLYEHPDLWSDAGTVTVYVEGQNKYKETDDTTGEKPAPESIKYDNKRWPVNNTSGNSVTHWGGFFAGDRKNYYITQNDYDRLINGLNEQERERFREEELPEKYKGLELKNNTTRYLIRTWEGSCYGLALTEGLHQMGEYYPKEDNRYCMNLGEVSTIENTDTPVESEINYYQFTQDSDEFNKRKYCDKDYSGLFNKANQVDLKENGGFLITYNWKEDGKVVGHTVLCYGKEKCDVSDYDGTQYSFRLKIYDSCSSFYDDDWCYVYLTEDKKSAYIPKIGLGKDLEIWYYDAPITKLATLPTDTGTQKKDTNLRIRTEMTKVTIKDELRNVISEFVNGVKDMVKSTLNTVFYCFGSYVEDSEFEFQGGVYELDTTDPDGIYSIEGGINDKLDATFEYGDHTVDVFADKTGVSAEFSNNGDVELNGLDATDFVINNVYNEDSTAKPGEATKVVVSANGTGDITYKKNAQGEFVLDDGDNGNSLKNVSIIIGTTLKSEKHDELPDAKGKITISFNGGEVVVKEDTNGDGDPDHVERFSDYVPVTKITVTPATASLAVGETLTLTASIEPANASDKKLFWFSDDPKVVTVSDGKITGVAAGTTVVRAVTGIGKAVGTCKVTVAGGADDPDDPDIPDDAPEGIWIKGLKKAYTYTGSAIKPEFRVYKGKTRLYEKTDYTVKITNNKKPGTATITLKMKGNYSGSKDVTFKIDRASLTTDVSADTVVVAYKKNKTQKPKPVLYINDSKLKYKKTDFEFTYPSATTSGNKPYSDVGTYQIHIKAKNTILFSGEKDVDLIITDKPLMKSVTITPDRKNVPYDNGKEVSPIFTLKYKGTKLSEGTDYTVTYNDSHTKIGKHTVTFTGNNKDYFGKKTYTFKITGKYDLNSSLATVSVDSSFPYTYGGAKPDVTVKYNGSSLTAGKDYSVRYTGHKTLGSNAQAIIKGKGSYKGTVTKTFKVEQRNINTLSLNIADIAYSNKAGNYKKAKFLFTDENYKDQKLKLDTDYTVEYVGTYDDAPAAGTEIKVKVTGKNNYTGTINTSYRIIDKDYDFSKANVVVNKKKAFDYTGSAVKPSVSQLSVTIGKGNNKITLTGDDYEIVGYFNNVKKGNSAYIRLRGKGKYSGVKLVKFKIGAASIDNLWGGMIQSIKGIFGQ